MIIQPTLLEIVATLCFTTALLHTLFVKRFQHWALQLPEGSAGENLLHLLGEVEVVFGLWAGVFLVFLSIYQSPEQAITFLEQQNFNEPIFVFVILVICSTRPILTIVEFLIDRASNILPFQRSISFFLSCLILGPLFGSIITEPAAMTVTALILSERLFKSTLSEELKYATLGLLFVNVSIGGTLTPYAATPILMVAKKWNWDLQWMLSHFGWRAALACILSTVAISLRFKDELSTLEFKLTSSKSIEAAHSIPAWLYFLHCIFLAGVVASSHHSSVVIGLFLFFLGMISITAKYQDELKLREGFLVAFFLGGLVLLGTPQKWWLEPLLAQLNSLTLFMGSVALTAVTDNAALTYLGSQVPALTEASRYALVAGAVTGGGLTVIANAPNPAGYGILNSAFGKEGISALELFKAALIPTLIAAACFLVG